MPRRKGTEPLAYDDRPVQAFRSLTLAIEAMRHATAQHLGIGVTEAMVLSELALHGVRTPTQLSESLDVPPSSVTRVLDRLEAAGGVARESVAGDRRQLAVVITDEGRSWLSWASDQAREALRAIPQHEVSAVADCMEALAHAIRSQVDCIQASESTRRS